MTEEPTYLSAAARLYTPRLFTIHGTLNTADERAFIGWGMEFHKHGTTLYYDPDARETRHCDTPDRLLKFYESIGNVRLERLPSK